MWKQDRGAYTVNGYMRDLRTFFAWLHEQAGREIPPEEVTFFDVKRYRDELEDARKKPATVNRAVGSAPVLRNVSSIRVSRVE